MVSVMDWEQVQPTASHLSILMQPATALSSAPQEYAQETNVSLTLEPEQTNVVITMELLQHAILTLQTITVQLELTSFRHAHQVQLILPVQQCLHLVHVQYAETVQVVQTPVLQQHVELPTTMDVPTCVQETQLVLLPALLPVL
jgi:hypothetical protein